MIEAITRDKLIDWLMAAKKDNARLQRLVLALADRVHLQSELLTRAAERRITKEPR